MLRRTLVLALSAAVALTASAHAAKSRLEVTVQGVDGEPIAGAAISLSAETGEPFTVAGVTDKKGKYKAEIPDFDRAYLLKVGLEGFTPREDRLDLAAQGFRPGQNAEVDVTLVPRGPLEIYNEGVRALQVRDTDAAIARFEEAVAAKPDFVEAWRVLSRLHLMGNRYEQALAAGEKVLASLPDDAEVLRDRYEALAGLGRAAEAEAALDLLAEKDKSPEVAKFLFNAGAAAWNERNAEAARRRFAQALEHDPKLYQVHQAQAEMHIDAKEWDQAIAELDRVIEIAPRNFKAYERKIEVFRAAGKAAEAEATQKALEALRGGG